jgi:hypothetical protein
MMQFQSQTKRPDPFDIFPAPHKVSFQMQHNLPACERLWLEDCHDLKRDTTLLLHLLSVTLACFLLSKKYELTMMQFQSQTKRPDPFDIFCTLVEYGPWPNRITVAPRVTGESHLEKNKSNAEENGDGESNGDTATWRTNR